MFNLRAIQVKGTQFTVKFPLRRKCIIAFFNSKNVTFSIKANLTKGSKIITVTLNLRLISQKLAYFLTDPKLYLNKDQQIIKKKTK